LARYPTSWTFPETYAVNLIVIYNFTLFVFGFIYEGADVRLCSLLPGHPQTSSSPCTPPEPASFGT
ncbi:MAG: hypothetical protein WAV83_10810, partial [Methanothrix sp.]|uniref:hypothetical protein n=1 Tax=Methanothrix sp. TaxID=90426 RepID=UPI003BAEBCAB